MTKKIQDLQPTRHYVIGIDPDVKKNGVAIEDAIEMAVDMAEKLERRLKGGKQ